MSIVAALSDPARPAFLFGSTPPREGTDSEKARETAKKFAARSALLATDGFIVYDIQDENSRNGSERPFPFRRTMDPAEYASFFPEFSGKECVVYKCVVEEDASAYQSWLDQATTKYGVKAFNLVGAASSAQAKTYSLPEAASALIARDDCKFGCVAIAERHTKKGNEHLNMLRKTQWGANWFITQGVFSSTPVSKLLHDYGRACREEGLVPKKVVLTFAPCGRPKTMEFIKWLGMDVPEEVEKRIFNSESPVSESVAVLCEVLTEIIQQSAGSGVPLGINIESLSIYKEEINAAHELFQKLQNLLLTSSGSPWALRWFYVDRPLRMPTSPELDHALLKKPVALLGDLTPVEGEVETTMEVTSGVTTSPELH